MILRTRHFAAVAVAAIVVGASAQRLPAPAAGVRSAQAVRAHDSGAAQTAKTLTDYSAAMQDLARSASPAVVQIMVRALAPVGKDELQRAGFVSEREATGSGVIVDPEGYIVTNAHVVENARRIEVKVLRSDDKAEAPHGPLVPAKPVYRIP